MAGTINLIESHRVIGQDSDRKRKMFRSPSGKLSRCHLLNQECSGWLKHSPKTCKADTRSITQNDCFKSHEQDASVFLAMQLTHMRRASCVKKPLHHLNSCFPSAGFAKKLISQGPGLAQAKQTLRRKYRQWVSKSRRERAQMLARLGFLNETPPRFQHSKEGKHG